MLLKEFLKLLKKKDAESEIICWKASKVLKRFSLTSTSRSWLGITTEETERVVEEMKNYTNILIFDCTTRSLT